MRKLVILSLFTLCLCVVNPAHAARSYSYVTDTPAVVTGTSTAVSVNLYLQETLTAGSSSIINTVEDGLFGAAIRVLRVPVLPSSPTTITDMTFNAVTTHSSPPNPDGFAGGSGINVKTITANDSKMTEAIALAENDGVKATVVVAGSINRVFLGSVQLLTGTIGGQTTTFEMRIYQPAGGNTITYPSGFDLDFDQVSAPAYSGASDVVNSFTVTTTSGVPEPATLLLACVGLPGLFIYGWKRRQVAMA